MTEQPMTEQPAEWLTVSQAAALVGVSEKTLRKRIARGDIVAERVTLPAGGWAWRVDANRLESVGNFYPREGSVREFVGNVTERDGSESESVTVENSQNIPTAPTDIPTASTRTDLARVQGYVARDMELVVGRAVEQAISKVTAPLLNQIAVQTEEIAALRTAHETLSGRIEAESAAHSLLMDELREARKDRADLRAELAKLTEAQQDHQEPPAATSEATQTDIEGALDKAVVPYLKQVQAVSAEVDRVNEENERLKKELLEKHFHKGPRLPWWKFWQW
jgi:excisionase family DNA binding protein